MEPWKALVIDSLRDLSDRVGQERSWVVHRDGAIPTPVELVESLFDDSGLGDLLADGPVFSPETDALLSSIGDAVDSLDLRQPPETLLADPRWQALRELAARALAAVTRETVG
jgi:hypothetical protein